MKLRHRVLFQFHLVRLKALSNFFLKADPKFQFHLVRLKEDGAWSKMQARPPFQFHLVRLKESHSALISGKYPNFNSI